MTRLQRFVASIGLIAFVAVMVYLALSVGLTVLILLVGIIVQPILFELSPMPDLIQRIKDRKRKRQWYEGLFRRRK